MARLDLDGADGFGGMGGRGRLLERILAIAVVLAAVVLVLNDLGWRRIGDAVSGFVGGVKRGAEVTLHGPAPEDAAKPRVNPLTEVAALQDGGIKEINSPPPESLPTEPGFKNFQPQGRAAALERINLAVDTAKIGMLDPALELIAEAREMDPTLSGADFLSAKLLMEAGREDEALPFLRAALDHSDERPYAAQRLGQIAMRNNQYAQALEYFEMAKPELVRDPYYLLELSQALRLNGRVQEGWFEARTAASLLPENRALATAVRMAAIEAGADEKEKINFTISPADEAATKTGTHRQESVDSGRISPFDMAVQAARLMHAGDREAAASLWVQVREVMQNMPSLRLLEGEPLVRQIAVTEVDPEVRPNSGSE